MAFETGDVTKVDPNPPPIAGDDASPEVTTAYRDPNIPDPSLSPVSSIAASLTPDVPDIPGGSYGPAASDENVASSVALPFVPIGMTPQQEETLRGTDAQILEDQIGARAGALRDLDRRRDDYNARMERLNAAIGHSIDNLRPWNADQQLAARKHDLWEQFGSPGFLIAMMGSAFTSMPMVSALNAGAAAMNAINQGDIDSYNTAFDAWKENTKLAIDRIRYEEDQFNNLEKLRTTNLAEWRERTGLLMDQFGDRRAKALLDAGYDDQVEKAREARLKAAQQAESNWQAHEENKALFDQVQQELKKPGTTYMDAYARALEKLTRAKNAGRFSFGGTLAPVWERAQQLFPDDIDAQIKYVQDYQKGLKGETKSAKEAEDRERIDRDLRAEHKDWTDTQVIQERNRIIAASQPKGTQAPVDPEVQKQIASNLETALGHPLSPELRATLQGAYQAKGAPAARIISSVSKAIDSIKTDLAAGKTEEEIKPADRINDAIVAASTAGARSATAAFMQAIKLEHPEWKAEQIQEAVATYMKTMAEARTFGTREANIAAPIHEVDQLAPLAIEASKKVPRGRITPFNDWKQVINRATGVSGQGELDVYTAGLLSAYAATISRGSVSTVEGQRRALGLLNTAYNQKTYEERVKAMQREMFAIQRGVRDAEKELLHGGEPSEGNEGWGTMTTEPAQ